jgi:Tol biopolymer transport system component
MQVRRLPASLTFALLLATAAVAQTTQRVSLSSTGVQGNNHSQYPSMSGDGRYVSFTSYASNLVAGDTNNLYDIFVRDRVTGTTERVSVASNGAEQIGSSSTSDISADGRYVVFDSNADNLVAGDTNGTLDVFLHDRQTGTTEIVSVDSSGVLGNDASYSPRISADGRFVAFLSVATNLVSSDTNGKQDVFVRDRQTGTTERVSVDSNGIEANDASGNPPAISADGRYVAFWSGATNLIPLDTNFFADIYVRDRQSGTTEVVSVDSAGNQGHGMADRVAISADGRYVAFTSSANDLVPGDTNPAEDAFVHDRQLGTTEIVSLSAGGSPADGASDFLSISADGRFVVFRTNATNLVPGDTNGFWDVYVRDRQLATTERVSLTSTGGNPNSDVEQGAPPISDDGRYVAFASSAWNLVPSDTNGSLDVFVRDRTDGTGFTSLCNPGVGGVQTCPCGNPPSALGRGCNNSAATGGAILSASGGAFLSSDSLVFTTSGEKPTATSVLLQGPSSPAAGVVYGQGLRCVGGTTKRLFAKSAVAGSITVPNFGAGDPSVSARSAAKGDVIAAGQSRWYLVFYRDPVVLGGCPATSTFNATQTGRIVWSP